MRINEISPDKFVAMLNAGQLQDIWIVDVREPHEWEYYHLEESKHIPMNEIPDQMSALPREQDMYIICAHGVRSAAVCQYLGQHGFDRVINVQGGMAAVSYVKDHFEYD